MKIKLFYFILIFEQKVMSQIFRVILVAAAHVLAASLEWRSKR